jgi:hypothetical protein
MTDFYRVEVSHRGQQTYARRQLEQDHWNVRVSLGSP